MAPDKREKYVAITLAILFRGNLSDFGANMLRKAVRVLAFEMVSSAVQKKGAVETEL